MTHLSGFEKRRALEALGYVVEKLPTPYGDLEWHVYEAACPGAVHGAATVIAHHPQQGRAILGAIDALGGL